MEKREEMAVTVATKDQNASNDFVMKQKIRLETEKKKLLEERADLTNPKKVSFNFQGDPAWETKINRVGEKLSAVEIALLRIKNGVYLICPRCGKEIEKQSLIACPERRICCQCVTDSAPPRKRSWRIGN